MSMVETWSIWMATFSFMGGLLQTAGKQRQSVKPAAQFLQQRRRALAQGRRTVAALDREKALERGNRRSALVQPGIDLAGFEQQLRPVGRDHEHAVEGAGRRRPIVPLCQPQA